MRHPLTSVLIVGLGGFVGAIARYGLYHLVHRCIPGAFPWGTLVVNVTGCAGIGAVMYLVEDCLVLSPSARLFWAVGLLGAFTTFSAFGHETLDLMGRGRWGLAAAYVGVSVVVGLAAVWLGRAALRAIGL